MRTEDQREVICGGDPENYLKAYFKGLYFDLDDGEEIKIIAYKEKFPFKREKFEELAKNSKLELFDFTDNGKEINLFLRK